MDNDGMKMANILVEQGVNGYVYDESTNKFLLKVEVINNSDNFTPEFKTTGAAGMDIRANLPSGPIILAPGEFEAIPTGIHMKVPENYEIQVRPRSGLAFRHGITVLNTPGTIDSDYTGEIKVILINHGKEEFDIVHGDRIAQLVINNIMGKDLIKTVPVDKFEETERGTGGFGSTGTN